MAVLSMIGAPVEPDGGSSLSVGPAIVLFVTIVLLLGLFTLGAVLLARSHRRRLATADRAAAPPSPDPWQEAGRRLRVPDEGADD